MNVHELKQYYDEYYEKKTELKELMKSDVILTHDGRCMYFTLKDRINYLRDVLVANSLILE